MRYNSESLLAKFYRREDVGMKKNVMRKCGWMAAVAAVCLLPCVAGAAAATLLGVLDPEDATAYLSGGA